MTGHFVRVRDKRAERAGFYRQLLPESTCIAPQENKCHFFHGFACRSGGSLQEARFPNEYWQALISSEPLGKRRGASKANTVQTAPRATPQPQASLVCFAPVVLELPLHHCLHSDNLLCWLFPNAALLLRNRSCPFINFTETKGHVGAVP